MVERLLQKGSVSFIPRRPITLSLVLPLALLSIFGIPPAVAAGKVTHAAAAAAGKVTHAAASMDRPGLRIGACEAARVGNRALLSVALAWSAFEPARALALGEVELWDEAACRGFSVGTRDPADTEVVEPQDAAVWSRGVPSVSSNSELP